MDKIYRTLDSNNTPTFWVLSNTRKESEPVAEKTDVLTIVPELGIKTSGSSAFICELNVLYAVLINDAVAVTDITEQALRDKVLKENLVPWRLSFEAEYKATLNRNVVTEVTDAEGQTTTYTTKEIANGVAARFLIDNNVKPFVSFVPTLGVNDEMTLEDLSSSAKTTLTDAGIKADAIDSSDIAELTELELNQYATSTGGNYDPLSMANYKDTVSLVFALRQETLLSDFPSHLDSIADNSKALAGFDF